jgi:S1-C subfamily serine protease
MNSFLSNVNIRKWLLLGFAALVAGIVIAVALPALVSKSPVETQGQMLVLQSEAAPQLGLVVDKNLRVIDVVKGGAADRAGVKKGDTLMSINAQRLATAAGAKKAFNRLAASKSVSLTVKRGSKELTVDIAPLVPQGISGGPTPTAVPSDMIYF